MSFWDRFGEWLATSETWTGPKGIIGLAWDHLWISVLSTAIAVALAVPVALWLAHNRRGRFLANAIANIGRAVPSFGVVVIGAVLFIRWGLPAEVWPLVITLVALAVPPLFTNTYTAVVEVDPATLEAARGMGHTEFEVLRQVEVPMATPLVLEGTRLAFVQVIATATLGAVATSGGGLGRLIIDGFATFRSGGDVELVGGAIAVALLTLLGERGFVLAERTLVPDGVRRLVEAQGPAV